MGNPQLRRETDFIYRVDRDISAGMNCDALVFGSRDLVDRAGKDGSIAQLINVSKLPGIVGSAMAMPDIHSGYGFPIGGVAAFAYDDGIISPGGVGYDINCGVSLVSVPLTIDEFLKSRKEVIDALFNSVPSGVGTKGRIRLTGGQLSAILEEGIEWAIANGIGNPEDRGRTDEYGSFKGADASKISESARARGIRQIGTLGAGNHFLEIQAVDQVLDLQAAEAFGLSKGTVTVMVHTGSRGLGHQVATDYIEKLLNSGTEDLPDRQLVYARSGERVFDDYMAAMQGAANFAFVNREVIIDQVRKVFVRSFNIDPIEMRLVYSISHNLARVEEHSVGGSRKKLIVHRKGATRAFPAGRQENGKEFVATGHPVLVPGSMGTKSYVLVGERENLPLSFGSTCHGAGRSISRHRALESLSRSKVAAELEGLGVMLKTASSRAILEEAPESYKGIEDVIESVIGAGLSRPVASLRPLGVVKG